MAGGEEGGREKKGGIADFFHDVQVLKEFITLARGEIGYMVWIL